MILRTVLRDRHDPADVEGQNAVWGALRAVDDPEYPGVSIVDLGLVEAVRIERGRVEVDLVPTFSGCPALEMIAADVRGAVAAIDGIEAVDVRFVPTPAWTPERITPAGRAAIAREFSVAVQAPSRPAECPRCGVAALVEESMFGPVRCRSIHVCRACGERTEVIR